MAVTIIKQLKTKSNTMLNMFRKERNEDDYT